MIGTSLSTRAIESVYTLSAALPNSLKRLGAQGRNRTTDTAIFSQVSNQAISVACRFPKRKTINNASIG
jgi:hypothetical protein